MKEKSQWKNGRTKSITFIVTKDCQLACKYCYLVGKNNKERMTWDTAKKAIDYILSHPEEFDDDSVIWDFIGGEPLLETELIDKICDYIKTETYRLGHKWFDSYRINITTNGLNYGSPIVQRFIEKNRRHISVSITIDGTKAKHDLNRVFKDSGHGSYDAVLEGIKVWREQLPEPSTKVTISSADLPYVKESVLHLFGLGIHTVNINCVFEDVWKEGDDKIFEDQLMQLADHIIDNRLYETCYCSFFSETIGHPLQQHDKDNNWCGSGKMLAIDAHGLFYPCNRFAKFSLREKEPRTIGNIRDGIDHNKLRPFLVLDCKSQSKPECLDCEVATGCAWCQGENYDAACTDTIYQRSTAICLMHKARVRANNYYWSRLNRILEIEGNEGLVDYAKPSAFQTPC